MVIDEGRLGCAQDNPWIGDLCGIRRNDLHVSVVFALPGPISSVDCPFALRFRESSVQNSHSLATTL